MNFQIDHPCPQCGGPVTLDETDRLLSCPYCRVRLHLTSTKGPFRYAMAPKDAPGDLVYIPYWRFKGTVYKAVPFKIDPHLLDATLVAMSPGYAPKSLGLRTQTQHLSFATREVTGRFAKPGLSFDQALARIENQVQSIRGGDKENFEKAYIGETTSLIFAPYKIEGNTLVDAILNQPAGTLPDAAKKELESSLVETLTWAPTFISAMCPYCGWDLKGDKEALVLVCKGCNAGWYPQGQEFKQVAVGTLPAKGNEKDVVYLPFWRIVPDITGMKLASRADLIRVANLPKAIQKEWETEDFAFWVPGFKVHPHLFLRASRQVTLTPFTGDIEMKGPPGESHPVNLPLAEAVQSLKVVLATFGKPPRTVFQRLPKIEITPRKGMLVFVPCKSQGGELVQEELGFAISKQALFYGKDM